MRPLEIVIPILLLIYLLWPLLSGAKRPTPVKAIPPITLLITIVHLLVEGYRWQMVPVYVIVGVVFVVWLLSLRHPGRGTYKRVSWESAVILVGVLALALAVALPAVLPVPKPLPPSGPYSVGTKTMVLVDESRRELYSDDPSEARKFMIQLWYPAQIDEDAHPAPWMPNADIVAPGIANWINMPKFSLDHLVLAVTSSFQDAPLDPTGGPYPVLLFSHGWGGFRSQNTYQLQELASHGYIVVGMQHTYGAVITVFPDGQVAYQNRAALPAGVAEDEYILAARQLVAQWSADMSFTLDYLEALNGDDPTGEIEGVMDLGKVGVLGHSTGGGATIQFCATDQRCQAGMPMDAYMQPVAEGVLDGGVTQPFLFLFSETWPNAENKLLFDRFYNHVAQPARVITILGTGHYDFSDLPRLSPLAPLLGLKGPLEGDRVLSIINDHTLAFFERTLKGEPGELLEGPSARYPEIRYDR